MTVNDKRYLLNRDNLPQPIQMQVSEQQNTFSQFFFCIFKMYINFKHLRKKMTLVADVFLEITVPKNMVRQMSKKQCFRGLLETEQRKRVNTLLESE